jgi:hypothetical protein
MLSYIGDNLSDFENKTSLCVQFWTEQGSVRRKQSRYIRYSGPCVLILVSIRQPVTVTISYVYLRPVECNNATNLKVTRYIPMQATGERD